MKPTRRAKYPSLYQINTRVLVYELSQRLKRPATLDDVPDEQLDQLAAQGFDWIWLLGVWQTGPTSRQVSRSKPDLLEEYRRVLPDFREEDVCGSCFAVVKYEVHTDFGGDQALARLRDRLHRRGLKLLLDFVPNHTGLDHEWIQSHPEFYVHGTEEQLRAQPQNYIRINSGGDQKILAYGRDPYFDGWSDTLQLNYANPELQEAMVRELNRVANLCDGVRCDMAMLILPDVFERTWHLLPEPFWPRAIQSVQARRPDFLFMAEVYWDLEWTLQQQGFTYTYDKRLYDRLREGHARPVREHFLADSAFQSKSARFLENHDEPRAAETFPYDVHRAAAVLTFFCPGLRFFHDGEFEGRRKKLPVHLRRRPDEPVDTLLKEFYGKLLQCVDEEQVRNGDWELLNCSPAWEGNWTSECFIGFAWTKPGEDALVVVVNYASNQSQCYVWPPVGAVSGDSVQFVDLMGTDVYRRNVDELRSKGLYLDLTAWGYHIFRVKQ